VLRPLIVVAALVSWPASAVQAQEVALFDGSTLADWVVEEGKADVRSGLIVARRAPGWVRYRRPLADFVLKADVRLGRDAAAMFYVRGWPTFDEKSSAPNNAYGVGISNRAASRAGQTDAETWQRLEIECVGRSLVARLDGVVVYTRDDVTNPQGYIALGVSRGTAEFRSISVVRRPIAKPVAIGDAVLPGPGVTLPRPLREVKPQYTAEAMRARVEGGVLLAAVVKTDGSVGDIQVLRSLDPKFGLDEQAREAAAQWRFVSGTKDGQPTAVVVTIELTFTLR
jgi:TonB family protein